MLRGAASSLPAPIPLATSYASLDPQASASFAIKYLGAIPAAPTNLSLGKCDAAFEAVTFPGSGYRLEFVRPGTGQPSLGYPLSQFVSYTESMFGDLSAASHQGVYSQWMDNHIGMIAEHMDPFVQALKQGRQPFFMRGGGPPPPPSNASAFYDLFVALPGTGHVFEQTALAFDAKAHSEIELVDWDLCSYERWLDSATTQLSRRRLGSGAGSDDHMGGDLVPRKGEANLWRKMTFASADPQAARDFAIKYLGANELPQAHEGGNGECALITWVDWPTESNDLGLPYQWHFVRADRKGGGSMNITDWRDLVEGRRQIATQVFDAYMWYHVRLWVPDLDPYVKAFHAGGVPYLIRGWPENGVWAVIVDLPGNGHTILLLSDHLTADQNDSTLSVPRLPFDLCH